MEVGIKIGPADGPEVKDAAVRAEALGFDSVWLSERVAIPLDKPHPYEPGTDPWIGLAFAAAVTERVRLGTSVSQIALRPPVLIARHLATLDRLAHRGAAGARNAFRGPVYRSRPPIPPGGPADLRRRGRPAGHQARRPLRRRLHLRDAAARHYRDAAITPRGP